MSPSESEAVQELIKAFREALSRLVDYVPEKRNRHHRAYVLWDDVEHARAILEATK